MDMKTYDFTWTPGWSFSRMRTFRTCLRQYWYRYYGKRNVPADERATIEVLLKLTSLPMEAGQAVHHTISEVLRDFRLTGILLPVDRAVEIGEDKYRMLIENTPLFHEMYGTQMDEERRLEYASRVRNGIQSFYMSRWPSMITSAPPEDREEWIIDPQGYGEFRFLDKKAYAKPDFLFRDPLRTWYVVDWKTGKPREGDMLQVQAYMFFTQEVFGIPLNEMKGAVEYLSTDDETLIVDGVLVNDLELRNRVLEDLAMIEGMCDDVERNLPKPVEEFVKSESRDNCYYCSFRLLCKPDVEMEGYTLDDYYLENEKKV